MALAKTGLWAVGGKVARPPTFLDLSVDRINYFSEGIICLKDAGVFACNTSPFKTFVHFFDSHSHQPLIRKEELGRLSACVQASGRWPEKMDFPHGIIHSSNPSLTFSN